MQMSASSAVTLAPRSHGSSGLRRALDPTAVRAGVKALGVALRAEASGRVPQTARDGLDAFLFELKQSQYPVLPPSTAEGYTTPWQLAWLLQLGDHAERDNRSRVVQLSLYANSDVALGRPIEALPVTVPGAAWPPKMPEEIGCRDCDSVRPAQPNQSS
jgi:hypothetical protein